jgi:ATPase subunit of ABC transporter with duplicated ATPase domains
VENLEKKVDGIPVLKGFNLVVNDHDKIAFIGNSSVQKSTLLSLIAGDGTPDSGLVSWGSTIKSTYFPKENAAFFQGAESLFNWLAQFSPSQETTYIRGFLGRMLFSGDEALKQVSVLSGGERVRCMLSRMMLTGANALILDEPTSHLDLEAITALNTGLIEFPGVALFTSHDHQFVSTIANRMVELTPSGVIDRPVPFEEYIASPQIQKLREEMYHGHDRINL